MCLVGDNVHCLRASGLGSVMCTLNISENKMIMSKVQVALTRRSKLKQNTLPNLLPNYPVLKVSLPQRLFPPVMVALRNFQEPSRHDTLINVINYFFAMESYDVIVCLICPSNYVNTPLG